MKITVAYKNGHYYPDNLYAELLASIIGKPSLTPTALSVAEALGLTVERIGGPAPKVAHEKRPVGRPKGPPKPPQVKRPVGRPRTSHLRPPKPLRPVGRPRTSHIPPRRTGSPLGLRGATYAPEGSVNIHQRQALRVLVGRPFEHIVHGQLYPVSKAQGKIVRSHFCGKRGTCGCAKGGIITIAPGEYALPSTHLCEFSPEPAADFT